MLAGLVVLDDPPRAERVDVDAVDLAAQVEAVAERQAPLQLGRRALRAEADLEPARHELQLRACLVAGKALEVAPQPFFELGRLQLRQVEPDTAPERVVEAAAKEAERPFDVLRRHTVVPEFLRQPRVELVQRAVRDGAAQHRVDDGVDRLRVR